MTAEKSGQRVNACFQDPNVRHAHENFAEPEQ